MTDETLSNTPAEASAPTGSQPGNAAPPADTGVPATPSAADASAETDTTKGEDGEQPPKPKNRGGFQKRIHEQTARIRSLERELAEAKAAKPPADADADAPPDRGKFANYDDYIDARSDWRAEQTAKRLERERTERAAAEAHDDRMTRFFGELKSDAAEDEVFGKAWKTFTSGGDNPFPVSQVMAEALADSDDPHGVIEYLANNRSEAERIYQMPERQAVRALTLIEAKAATVTPARTPQAPPPPPTVNGRSTPRFDLQKIARNSDAGEYIRMRREQMAKA